MRTREGNLRKGYECFSAGHTNNRLWGCVVSIVSKFASRLVLCFSLASTVCVSAALAQGQNTPASPVNEQKAWENQAANERVRSANKADTTSKAAVQPGEGMGCDFQCGMGFDETPQQQAMQHDPIGGGGGGGAGATGPKFRYEALRKDNYWKEGQYETMSIPEGAAAGSYDSFLKRELNVQDIKLPKNGDAKMGGSDFLLGGSGGGGGGGACTAGQCPGSKGTGGGPEDGAVTAAGANQAATGQAAQSAQPSGSSNQAKSNGQGNQASAASSAGEDAMECMMNAMDGMTLSLINVGNEDAGSPCASNQISKTYANAVWMVQRMYKQCFLPMAILFLLPGALITNIKTFIGFGILHNSNDEDSVSPWTGILRSIIAIFLIPMTQVIVSYMVDVGNSLQYSCQPYVNVPLIILWAEEQVQIFKPDQQGNPIKNLPTVPMAPWRGKFAGMPVKGAVLEQIGGLDAALSELANECTHILSEGLTIAHAFQVVMICYLLCLGPLAAAFFAWPSVGRDLFRKAFASWVDGVVILSLWKFWWNIVLICMTVHIESGGMNPFDPFEVYYLCAFLCILMFVPFNPFDFKPGEIVGHAMKQAEGVAAKVAQGGKGGGSGGGGGKGGGKTMPG